MKKITLTNMKKLLFIIAILLISSAAYAAQVDMIIGSEGSKASLTTNFSRIQNNFTELFGRTQTANDFTTPLKNKLDGLPEGTNILTRTNTDVYTPSLDYHPATKKYVDEAPFAPAQGADDNYVTDAEKTVIGNTSGTNTGDQILPVVSDTAYNATSWDANTDAPSKNAVRDKIETIGVGLTSLPTATNQIIQATGAGTYEWTSSVAGLIDDTAGDGDTDKLLSADKVVDLIAAGGAAFAFDTFPIYEDSDHSSGIAVNGTTLAVYDAASSKWLTAALTDTLDPAPSAPTVTSVTVGTLGLYADILFSEAITAGANGPDGWSMLCDGVPVTMTYSSGDTTATLAYALSPTPYAGDVCTVDYAQPGNGLEDGDGIDVASIDDGVVVNNSEVVPSGWTVSDSFSSDTLANYNQLNGTYNMVYDSGNARVKGGTVNQRQGISNNTPAPDNTYYVQALVNAASVASATTGGVVFNSSGSSDTATGYFVKPFGTFITLYKMTAGIGAQSTVGNYSYTGGKTWADAENHLIKIVVNGTTFSCYVDFNNDSDFDDADESLGNKTDATYSGTQVGVMVYSSTAWVDNLTAGDM